LFLIIQVKELFP